MKEHCWKHTTRAIMLGLMVGCAMEAQSIPPLMNYQGRLTDEAGEPLADGTYLLAFRLYSSAVPEPEEQLIWGAEYDVTLLEGIFNVVLGASGGSAIPERAVNELTYAFTEPHRFLELRVLRDAEGVAINRAILPRHQLLSAPFAIMSGNGVPPGSVMPYFGTTAPPGWLMCDGTSYPQEGTYARLFAVIGRSCGSVNESEFNVPDLRGRFLRGVDVPTGSGSPRDPNRDGRGAMAPGGNPGNAVGSVQGDATKRPMAAFTTSTAGAHTHALERQDGTVIRWGDGGGYSHHAIDAGGEIREGGRGAPRARIAGAHSHTITGGGDAETRPMNVYVNYIIKY